MILPLQIFFLLLSWVLNFHINVRVDMESQSVRSAIIGEESDNRKN
jgi:hypothetical protein